MNPLKMMQDALGMKPQPQTPPKKLSRAKMRPKRSTHGKWATGYDGYLTKAYRVKRKKKMRVAKRARALNRRRAK